jgi:hypothetical protein
MSETDSPSSEQVRAVIQMQQDLDQLRAENERIKLENVQKTDQIQGLAQMVQIQAETQQKLEHSRGWARVRELEHDISEMSEVQALQAARLARFRQEIAVLKTGVSRCRLEHRPPPSPRREAHTAQRQIHLQMRSGASGRMLHEPWHYSKRTPGITDVNSQKGLLV